jgi:hypothetical protein
MSVNGFEMFGCRLERVTGAILLGIVAADKKRRDAGPCRLEQKRHPRLQRLGPDA